MSDTPQTTPVEPMTMAKPNYSWFWFGYSAPWSIYALIFVAAHQGFSAWVAGKASVFLAGIFLGLGSTLVLIASFLCCRLASFVWLKASKRGCQNVGGSYSRCRWLVSGIACALLSFNAAGITQHQNPRLSRLSEPTGYWINWAGYFVGPVIALLVNLLWAKFRTSKAQCPAAVHTPQ